MRHSVTTLGYRFRKALDNLLYSLNWKHVTAKDVTAPLLDKTFINSGLVTNGMQQPFLIFWYHPRTCISFLFCTISGFTLLFNQHWSF